MIAVFASPLLRATLSPQRCRFRPAFPGPPALFHNGASGNPHAAHGASKGGTRRGKFPGHVANVSNQSTHRHVVSQKTRSSTHYRAPYDRRVRTGTPRHNRATPLGISTYLQPLWQAGAGSKKTEQRVAECHESTVNRGSAVQVSETSPSSSSSSPRVTGPAPDPAARVPPPAPP